MNAGKVALKRGPLVYCLEQTDNPGARVTGLMLARDSEFNVETRSDLLSGLMVLTVKGEALTESDWDGDLYRSTPPVRSPSLLTAVPYYAWNNRESGPMTVWIHETIADPDREI